MSLRHATPLALIAAILGSGLSGAEAQRRRRPAPEPPGVEVRLSPYRPAGVEREAASRWLYLVELVPTGWPRAEVVADRRLLRLEVHPEGSRRRLRCSHPDAPRRVDEARVQILGQGAEGQRSQEWIDLRMYCWGRALRALEGGARVEVRYGFARPGRGRWVARRPGGEGEVRELAGAALALAATPEPPAAAGAVRVELSPADVRHGSALSFRPRLLAGAAPARVYLRDDLFSFLVDGPMGRTLCEVPREEIVPIVDFFTRLRGRRAARTSIDADRWCPEGTFDLAGVYDVTPLVDLIYDGDRYGFEAATGRFTGRPAPVRVRRGEHGYVEQRPGGAGGPARGRAASGGGSGS